MHTPARPRQRQETGQPKPDSRWRESIRRIAAEELAPGGHQEQGESRVTVFRAPDWQKTSGAEVAKDRDCPLGKRVSADADERHLKDSDGLGGFPQKQEARQ
jgi:hypothetical protein